MEPMTWMLLGGTALDLLERESAKKEKKKHDKIRAAQMRYSPWTNMAPEAERKVPGMLSTALRGAATGGLIGDFLKMGKTPADAAGEGKGLLAKPKLGESYKAKMPSTNTGILSPGLSDFFNSADKKARGGWKDIKKLFDLDYDIGTY